MTYYWGIWKHTDLKSEIVTEITCMIFWKFFSLKYYSFLLQEVVLSKDKEHQVIKFLYALPITSLRPLEIKLLLKRALGTHAKWGFQIPIEKYVPKKMNFLLITYVKVGKKDLWSHALACWSTNKLGTIIHMKPLLCQFTTQIE